MAKIGGKPETPVELNRNHRLAQGLDLDWIGGAYPLVNVANPGDEVSYNAAIPTEIMTAEGLGTDFPGGADNTIDLGSEIWLAADREFTLAIQFEYHVAGGFNHLLHLLSDEDDFQIITADGQGSYEDLAWGSPVGVDTWGLIRSGAGTVNPNELNTVVIRFDGIATAPSNYDLDVNGVSRTPLAGANFLTPTVSTNMLGTVTTNWFNGVVLGLRVWGDIRLSDEEALELSLNFWEPFGEPLEITGPKRKGFFAPVAGLLTHTAAAVAQGIAARNITVFKTITTVATGIAGAIGNILGALTTHTAAAIAVGVASVQRMTLKDIAATASGIANVATLVISGLTEVAVAAVATGVVTVQRSIFKTVRATASGIAGAAGSTGALFLQSVVAVAQGIAKRNVIVFKTLRGTITPRIISTTISTETASETLTLNMPDERPDNDLYFLCVRNGWSPESGRIEPLAGWTTLSLQLTRTSGWIAWRLGSDEPSSYEIMTNLSISSTIWHGAVVRVGSFDISSPINTSDDNKSSTVAEAPTVTPTVDNPLILRLFSYLRFEGVEDITATPDVEIFKDSLIGIRGPFPADIRIGNAASFEAGAKDIATGTAALDDDSPPLVGVGVTVAITPDPTPAGPRAFGIVATVFRVITNFPPFTGFGGLGMVDQIKTRWQRRRTVWRRRR